MGGRARRLASILRIVLPIVLWSALLLLASGFVPSLRGRAIRNDFAIYYVSALELREGVDPYATDFTPTADRAGLEIQDVTRSTEPPFALLIFEPLTRFAPLTAFTIWQSINFISLIGALVLLLRKASGLSGSSRWTLAAFALAYPPVLSHFWYGQSKLPILLMLVMGAHLLTRGYEATAGLILAFAGLLRVYPLVIAGYLVLERRWRALVAMGLGVMAGGLATVMLIGPTRCVSFAHGLSYLTTDQWIAKSGDNAPLASLVRLIHASAVVPTLSTACQHGLLIAIDFVLLSLTARATLLHPIADADSDFRIYALWVMTAIVLPPVAWDYDMVIALLPFACVAVAASSGRASARTIALAIASYALIALWRFSGIRDTDPVVGVNALTLRETASLSLIAAYVATYWFVTDGAAESIPLWQVPSVAWSRIFHTRLPQRSGSREVTG
jgi:hypothetical protein